jgi:hypothetical protein
LLFGISTFVQTWSLWKLEESHANFLMDDAAFVSGFVGRKVSSGEGNDQKVWGEKHFTWSYRALQFWDSWLN